MRPNVMFERLRKGEVLIGLCNMYPAAGIIEGMCGGWDYVWIDGQHGQMSYDSCLAAMHAAGAMQLETLLRVPGHDHSVLGPMADLSPSALMVPMVNNAAQAKHVVSGLRFPPLGERSYGGRRVIDLDGRDYFREREMLVVAQIETLEAVANVDQIIGTEGVDMVFFGPDDMKVRMGLPINTAITDHPDLREAMATTAKAAKAAGKFAGCVGANAASLKMAVEQGYQLVVGGGDIAFMRTLAAERLTELRGVLGTTAAPAAKARQGSGVYGG